MAPWFSQVAKKFADSGILKEIEDSSPHGLTLEAIVEKVQLPHYGVRVLLESGLGIGLVIFNNDTYKITKTGHFILHDSLTNVNNTILFTMLITKAFLPWIESIKTGQA